MTQDTYLRIVKQILMADPDIRIQASHQTKLNALARQVARGETSPRDTINAIEMMFHPFFSRSLREKLERALR